jgi:hypothetical protein
MGMFDHREAGRDWHYREAPVRLMSAESSYITELSQLPRFDVRVCLRQYRTCNRSI